LGEGKRGRGGREGEDRNGDGAGKDRGQEGREEVQKGWEGKRERNGPPIFWVKFTPLIFSKTKQS